MGGVVEFPTDPLSLAPYWYGGEIGFFVSKANKALLCDTVFLPLLLMTANDSAVALRGKHGLNEP